MSFTAFIDNLALVEVLIAFVAALCAYAGLRAWWAIRQNDAHGLRAILKGAAVPLGATGVVTLAIALWGEMTWPFLTSDGLGGYNIFFFDPLLLLGVVLLAYAVSVYAQAKLQYFGLLALIAGAVVMFYGYTGYTATPAFTKDPLDTLLMYLAFGATGIAVFPATVVVDYYLGAVDSGKVPFSSGRRAPRPAGEREGAAQPQRLGNRAVQPVVPGAGSAEAAPEADAEPVSYRVPKIVQLLILGLPIFAALAAIAAFWYFGTTLPGHLGSGPAGAP